MAKSYRPVDRAQQFLLPPDMAQWLDREHFVWFLIEVLDELDMSAFEVGSRRGGVGRQAYDPRMLLGLLIYAYATGQRSSRRIEDLCGTDVAFRVLCAQDVPDHSTIARFRQRHQGAAVDLFCQVLELAGQAGLGRVGVVAIDGTKIAANASFGANRKRSWLREQVDRMMAEAAQVDAAEDEVFGEAGGDEFAPGWGGRGGRRERIRAALAKTAEREQAAGLEDQDKVARWQARADRWDRKADEVYEQARARFERYQSGVADADQHGGPRPPGHPSPPPERARPVRVARGRAERARQRRDHARQQAAKNAAERTEPRANVTDPDSGPMPSRHGWIQGYNAQLVVSDDQIIMAAQVSDRTGDATQYEPMAQAAEHGAQTLDVGRRVGGHEPSTLGTIVADAGYLSVQNLQTNGPDRLIAVDQRHKVEKAAREQSTPVRGEPSKPGSATLIQAMSTRLRTDAGLRTYRRRGVTVEPVNGHLKDRIGLRQFSRRGLTAAQAELEFAAATANLLKIHRHGH